MLSVGHVHAPTYVHCLQNASDAEFLGLWDKDSALASKFARDFNCKLWEDREALIDACDAVVIAGENLDHAELVEAACAKGKAILCEKPLAATRDQSDRIEKAVNDSGAILMTAFPCPFSPAFESAVAKIKGGEIGKVLSVCATNHGKCPGGWFVEKEKSGGGAMVDHVVHVANLLEILLGEQPTQVQAITGNNMNGHDWEDSAMLSLQYASGVFATLDSSWSRPDGYKTWGDVTMKIVGEKGVLELDLFSQALDWYRQDGTQHGLLSYGSNLDQLMVGEFLRAVREQDVPSTGLAAGLSASRVFLAAYESAASGKSVAV